MLDWYLIMIQYLLCSRNNCYLFYFVQWSDFVFLWTCWHGLLPERHILFIVWSCVCLKLFRILMSMGFVCPYLVWFDSGIFMTLLGFVSPDLVLFRIFTTMGFVSPDLVWFRIFYDNGGLIPQTCFDSGFLWRWGFDSPDLVWFRIFTTMGVRIFMTM